MGPTHPCAGRLLRNLALARLAKVRERVNLRGCSKASILSRKGSTCLRRLGGGIEPSLALCGPWCFKTAAGGRRNWPVSPTSRCGFWGPAGASKQLRELSETGLFRLPPAAVFGVLRGCFVARVRVPCRVLSVPFGLRGAWWAPRPTEMPTEAGLGFCQLFCRPWGVPGGPCGPPWASLGHPSGGPWGVDGRPLGLLDGVTQAGVSGWLRRGLPWASLGLPLGAPGVSLGGPWGSQGGSVSGIFQ